MSDVIEKKIKDAYDKADSGLKKAGVVAAAVTAGPAVVAGVAGEKAVDAAKSISEKAKELNVSAQIKKYNPLFPEKYQSEGFTAPNMLTIVDNAARKDIEVCKGAIGWISNQNKVEVMHLYDEAATQSGIEFVPAPLCDSIYYVDPHNRNVYVNIDNMFDYYQNQKLAELSNVAYCLGAKHYSIEIIEEEKVLDKFNAKTRVKANAVKAVEAETSAEYEANKSVISKRRFYTEGEYEVRRIPYQPKLTWFSNDASITSLIEQVCSGESNIKSKVIVFEGSKFAVMSKTAASKLDGAIKKLGALTSANMEKNIEKEQISKIIFRLEF